jgi:VanZ family protein
VSLSGRLQLFWRYLFFISLPVIALMAVLPPQELAVSTGWDKSNHALAFFLLLALLDLGYPTASMSRRKIPGLLLYGVFLELLQSFYPDRFASLLDVLADAVGLVCYLVIRPILIRRFPWFYKSSVEARAGQADEI